MLQISNRLQALAGFVTEGNILADIGTDHGYVPIYLMQQGKIRRAIAMDVRKGPLGRAQENIAAAGFDNYIETRLSDGLDKLSIGEADTILIAGMGGPLMERILRAHMEVARSAKELILQPQSEVKEFRYFLAEQGFHVQEEHMLFEDGKYYVMMKGAFGAPYKISPLEAMFGALLLEERPPVFLEYLHHEYEKAGVLLEQMAEASNPRTCARRVEVEAFRQMVEGLF